MHWLYFLIFAWEKLLIKVCQYGPSYVGKQGKRLFDEIITFFCQQNSFVGQHGKQITRDNFMYKFKQLTAWQKQVGSIQLSIEWGWYFDNAHSN